MCEFRRVPNEGVLPFVGPTGADGRIPPAARRRVARNAGQALKDAGWNNYSLFLDDDGLLIGYLECDDFDAAGRAWPSLT
jgi:hypothetical protein